jgi:hypothetical protein
MREHVQAPVPMLHQARENSALTGRSPSPSDGSDKHRVGKDPYEAAYETFKKTRQPDD